MVAFSLLALEADAQITLQEALDDPEMTWTTGGSIPWTAQTNVTHDGVSAATAGKHDSWNAPSWLETAVLGPGTLRFWWKVSCQTNATFLELWLDGVRQAPRIAGEVNWRQESLAVPAGIHKLRWQFPGATWGELEYGWLDQVGFDYAEVPPEVVIHPKSQTNYVEGSARFETVVSGGRPIAFQWQFNGTNVPAATNAVLSLASTVPSNAGSYRLLATNALGATVSSNAFLALLPSLLHLQPKSQTVPTGSVVSFSVAIESPPWTALRWYRNGEVIVAGFITNITLPNVSFGDAAIYSVVISNQYGTVTSSNALLNVVPRVQLTNKAVWPGPATDIQLNGNLAFVLQATAPGYAGEVAILDISDPSLPSLVGAIPGRFIGVAVEGHHFYGVAGMSFSTFDFSEPLHPFGTNIWTYAYSVFVNQRRAYVVDNSSVRSPYIVDLTDPFHPVGLSSGITYRCAALDVVQPYAYLLSGDLYVGNKLEVVDVSKPENPKVMGSVPVASAQDIAVAGPFAYVAARTNGLRVIDVSDPSRPIEVAALPLPGRVVSICIAGSLAFLADDLNGRVQVIDLSLPELPGKVGEFLLSGRPYRVRACGRYVYATGNHLWILETPFSGNPAPVMLVEPSDHKSTLGGSTTFSASVLGNPPFAYQWRFNGADLTGATNFALSLTIIQPESLGCYSVVASNPSGSVTSAPASLGLITIPRIQVEAAAHPHFISTNLFGFKFWGETNVVYEVESTAASGWGTLWRFAGRDDFIQFSNSLYSPRASEFYRVRVP